MKEDRSGKVRLSKRINKMIKKGSLDPQGCTHLFEIQDVVPSAKGCEDCLKIGDEWVSLRLCLTCGYVGCCNSSKNKHASRHFNKIGHPMIVSYQPGEDWIWCYVDELTFSPKK